GVDGCASGKLGAVASADFGASGAAVRTLPGWAWLLSPLPLFESALLSLESLGLASNGMGCACAVGVWIALCMAFAIAAVSIFVTVGAVGAVRDATSATATPLAATCAASELSAAPAVAAIFTAI